MLLLDAYLVLRVLYSFPVLQNHDWRFNESFSVAFRKCAKASVDMHADGMNKISAWNSAPKENLGYIVLILSCQLRRLSIAHALHTHFILTEQP